MSNTDQLLTFRVISVSGGLVVNDCELGTGEGSNGFIFTNTLAIVT